MHKEPNSSLPKTADRIRAEERPADSIRLLKGLDQTLSQREDAIKAEFREITQVRECIRRQLLASGSDTVKPPGILGQVWGK